jgi:hypothetical protein
LLLLLCLAEKRVVGGGGLLTVVLVDAHALVRVIGVSAAGAERDRVHVERVAGLGLLQDKLESALFAAGQVFVDQLSAGGAGIAAGRRTELLQRGRVLSVLRVVLRLRGMDGGLR